MGCHFLDVMVLQAGCFGHIPVLLAERASSALLLIAGHSGDAAEAGLLQRTSQPENVHWQAMDTVQT
jgi:hypothetical protein